MADIKKVNSVAVGASSTQWGGANAGGKHKGSHKAPRPALVASGGAGGNKNKMSSGTYKNA